MKNQPAESTTEITAEKLTGNPADKIEQWSIDKLIPYARNSRTHSDEQIGQIAASIKEWGWTTPILVDEQGGIIAGHGRTMAAQRLKIKTVPVMVATGWSEAKKRAYIIADNRLALNAGWDNAMLATEFKDLMDLGFDVGLTGFTEEEIDALMPLELEEGLTDPDDAPEAPANPVTVQGDVWVMGSHRLLCGDSTSIDDLEKLCAGQPVDMWLTDPPYNVAYEGGTKEKLTIKNDSMGDTQFREFLRDAYTAANAVMKAGAVFYIWHADSEGYNFRGAAKDAGWTVRQCLIWKKSSLVLGRQDYQWQHEPCLYGAKKPDPAELTETVQREHETALYGWTEGAAHVWNSDRKQTTVLYFDRPTKSGDHPTMKPVALFAYLIQNSSRREAKVYDPFMGSGTTLMACEQLGRTAYGMELDPRFVDVIVKRWETLTGQKAEREEV